MGSNRGIRSSSNWRYRVIKNYKKRAQKFFHKSDTFEEREAWKKVISWFEDILNTRFLKSNRVIGIPKVNVEDFGLEGLPDAKLAELIEGGVKNDG